MKKRSTFYVIGYFSLLFILGLCIYKDYGVSWDESIDRMNGLVNAKYIASRIAPAWAATQPIFADTPIFYTYLENDHGALFHLPLAFWEVARGEALDSRTYYHIRHFSIFLTFILGGWALYKLGRFRFQSWQLGLLASLLLVLSPRFFADAFYNGKDLVFTVFFTLGIYTLVRLLRRPTIGAAILHGLATAAATDIRILGCLLPAFTLGMLVLEAWFSSSGSVRRRLLGLGVVYSGAAVLFTVIGWPYLWEEPLNSFLLAFENMRQFRWEGPVFYLGQNVSSLALPWHYVPVWIIVTTPVAYTLAFLTGVFSYCYALLQSRLAHLRTLEGRLDLLFAGWFLLPILMIILLDSVIYDGWRHLYFVYPAFLLLAVRGVQLVWQARTHQPTLHRVAVLMAVLAAGEVLFTMARMISGHPNQQVFFSFLPAAKAEKLFERDYWGISYRQGLEWILAHDTSAQIPVTAPVSILLENGIALMRPEARQRFQLNVEGPKGYFLTNYRYHPEPYPDSVGQEVHVVRANGIKILSVFKRH